MKHLSFLLLAFALVCTISSCTKKSNCEMVKGSHFTGYYEYHEDAKAAGIFEFNTTPNITKAFYLLKTKSTLITLGLNRVPFPTNTAKID